MKTRHSREQKREVSGASLLHNVGAPMSRREQKVCQTLESIHKNTAKSGDQYWFIPTPPDGKSFLGWLDDLAVTCNHAGLTEALRKMPVPSDRQMVIERFDNSFRRVHESPEVTLHHAAVLARIGKCLYDPERPPVLSERRMARILQLIPISTEDFYELD